MSRGFTLIEVLVALVIAALLAASLGQSARAASRRERWASRDEAAARIAAAALEEELARADDAWQAGSRSSSVQGDGFSFTRTVSTAPGPVPGLWLAEVSVTPADGRGPPVRLATLRRVAGIRP